MEPRTRLKFKVPAVNTVVSWVTSVLHCCKSMRNRETRIAVTLSVSNDESHFTELYGSRPLTVLRKLQTNWCIEHSEIRSRRTVMHRRPCSVMASQERTYRYDTEYEV